jgi:hypothetical protein
LALSSNAHTYRLLIVKELCSGLLSLQADEALCSSAEERYYEAFRRSCHAHFLVFRFGLSTRAALCNLRPVLRGGEL